MIVTGPLEKLPTYLSYRGSGPDVVQKQSFEKKWSFEKSFLKWSFFLGDCDRAFEKAAYVPLS